MSSSPFKEKVIEIVKKIPAGKVVSYGQVACYIGAPRAAREVGWILNGIDTEKMQVPWWRVVNNSGRISIKGSEFSADDQKILLEKDGIEINSDFTFDIEKYRFKADEKFIKKLNLDPFYIDSISSKLSFRSFFKKLI